MLALMYSFVLYPGTFVLYPGTFLTLALHPDKTKLFFTTGDTVEVINVDGSDRTTIYNRDSKESRLYGLAIDDKQRLPTATVIYSVVSLITLAQLP